MLIEMIPVRAVQVSVVQIIRVIAMPYRRMATTLPVQVRVPFMEFVMIPQCNAFYNKNITRRARQKVT